MEVRDAIEMAMFQLEDVMTDFRANYDVDDMPPGIESEYFMVCDLVSNLEDIFLDFNTEASDDDV
jgi:hypothetical protein